MEFKGTKGKWILKEDISTQIGGVVLDENNISICSIFNGSKLNRPNKTYCEVKANALLISKAPEMLEMLQSLENDNNAIPELMWSKIQQLIKQATEL